MNDTGKIFFVRKIIKESRQYVHILTRLFMILIKKYKVRLFIILTHFKDGNWY